MEVISQFVHLQKKGRDYWACCPFHHEKTPSFQVRSDHQYFKCFGCQKSGNVITFIMEHERMLYPEAVEWLASRANMQLPDSFEGGEGYRESKQLKEKIHNANREAARFYFQTLFTEDGAEALRYLRGRGLNDQTVTTFGMGYSPNPYALPAHMEKIGYDKATLKKAGLCGVGKNGESYDFFSGRIVVPIIDAFNNVIGFGGRVLKDNGFAKYKNTLATAVFDKSRALFNINLFKKLKQTEPVQSAILVEGYMDAVSLYQAGIKNVVAPMGTSLTPDQCRILKRYVDAVYVCFDGDSAGQAAALRSLDLLKTGGLEVRVMELPDKLDPDDVIKQKGKDYFETLITKALPLIDYKLKKAEQRYGLNTADGRQKYVKAAAKVLAQLDDVERAVYAKTVSEKSGIAADTVLSASGGADAAPPLLRKPSPAKTRRAGDTIAARYALSSLLSGKTFASAAHLRAEFFDNETHKAVFAYLLNEPHPMYNALFDITQDSDEINEIIAAADSQPPENAQSYYIDSVMALLKRYRAARLPELSKRLMDPALTDEERARITNEIKELSSTQYK